MINKYNIQTISAVLIVKNEERHIRNCLESVKWVNEIIIIDDSSIDRTIEIAKGYTNKIFTHKLDNNFSQQRQFGAEKATSDWILHLDADEIVTDKMRKEIRCILKGRCDTSYIAYKFKRKQYFLGHFMEYGGWYHYHANFFKKGAAYYKNNVHELLIPCGRIGSIDADILHFSIDNLSEYIKKCDSYITIEVEELVKKGIIKKRELYRNLLYTPLKSFWKAYIKKKGYKEGLYGLVLSIYSAFYHFMKWARYWEIFRKKYYNESK